MAADAEIKAAAQALRDAWMKRQTALHESYVRHGVEHLGSHIAWVDFAADAKAALEAAEKVRRGGNDNG